MVQAAGTKPVWMTLQIAWSGVVTSQKNPRHVPRFPTLQQERFMAYQAIVNGARGLVFFGGHLTAGRDTGRRRRRLELDVLGARPATARQRAQLSGACACADCAEREARA